MSRCIHDWKVLDKTILPSGIEQLSESITSATYNGYNMHTKKVVVIVTCSKCGAIQKFTEQNP